MGKLEVGRGSGLKINKTAEDLKSFAFGKYFTSTLVTCAFSQTNKRLKSDKRCDDDDAEDCFQQITLAKVCVEPVGNYANYG